MDRFRVDGGPMRTEKRFSVEANRGRLLSKEHDSIYMAVGARAFGLNSSTHVKVVVAVPCSHFSFVRSPEKHQGRPGGPNSV
ncbi:unnamed protein product, partial [Iphiclides podalirius]